MSAVATLEDARPISWRAPVLFGCLINWLLMGTIIVQTFYFHIRRSKDKPTIQVLVYTVVMTDVIQTAFVTHVTWWLDVATFGQGLSPEWSISTIPGMAGLTSALVQIFYAWRIYQLSQKKYMHGFAILIVAMAIAQCSASFVSSSAIGITDFVQWEIKLVSLYPAITAWLVLSFCTDIIISACMIFILLGAKLTVPQTSRTQKLLNELILNTIRTGILTVLCVGTDLFLFHQFPDAFYYVTPGIIAGKLQTNSFLSTLNARDLRVNKLMAGDGESFSLRVQVTRTTERAENVDLDTTLPRHGWSDPGDLAQKKGEEI